MVDTLRRVGRRDLRLRRLRGRAVIKRGGSTTGCGSFGATLGGLTVVVVTVWQER